MNIDNSMPNKTLNGSGDSDSITNSGALVKIYAQDGNDTVDNSANLVTISGGAGNDSIYSNESDQVLIFGGSGDDTISNRNYGVRGTTTINAGKGTDLVNLGGDSYNSSVIQYTYGDGDDTIIGFDSNDTLQITTTKKYQTMTGGSDIYVIFDEGSIVLKNTSTANIVTVKGGGGDSEKNKWRLSGTTATYGTSSKLWQP